MTSSKTKQLVTMGILIAISIILIVSPLRFPYPAAPFLEYDAGDIPILIGGFIFGPLAGILLSVVTAIVQAVTVSSGSGWIGCVMHIFATSAFVGISAAIYLKNKTLKSAIIGLILGSLARTAIMIPLNMLLYPLFAGTPMDAVIKMIVPILLPFNLMKGAINSIAFILIFKSAGKLLQQITQK